MVLNAQATDQPTNRPADRPTIQKTQKEQSNSHKANNGAPLILLAKDYLLLTRWRITVFFFSFILFWCVSVSGVVQTKSKKDNKLIEKKEQEKKLLKKKK